MTIRTSLAVCQEPPQRIEKRRRRGRPGRWLGRSTDKHLATTPRLDFDRCTGSTGVGESQRKVRAVIEWAIYAARKCRQGVELMHKVADCCGIACPDPGNHAQRMLVVHAPELFEQDADRAGPNQPPGPRHWSPQWWRRAELDPTPSLNTVVCRQLCPSL